MKYLVCTVWVHETDADDGGSCGEPDVRSVEPCRDTREVAAAIARVNRERDAVGWRSWAVFEIVGQTAVRRAVVLKWDGKALYDVEISR